MKLRLRLLCKVLGALLLVLVIAGFVAPVFTVDQFGRRLQASLERSLGRRVEIGKVHFNLFKGPGFSVDNVTIYEDPAIGMEPVVYIQEPDGSMEVAPSVWSLLGGRFVIASIRLDGASINLAKSGPASEWGRWNFASIVNPSVIRTAPAIHVRGSRIHFKFGDTKSVFYLTETDMDISPSGPRGDWKIAISAQPARTDRPAQGLGLFTLKGRWYAVPGRVDLDMEVDRAALGEVTALVSGQDAGVHGTLSWRLHLAGPLDNMGITGRLDIGDVHRWDMLPGNSQGWRQQISGRLDLIGQQIELHSITAGNTTLPLAVHFRATDYLSQPHWAVGLNWNRFPVAPIMELARHMGAQFPPKLQLTGTMDGAIGYSGQGSLQGALAFHDTALAIPDSPAVRFEQANIILGDGHARLSPALVRGGEKDEARIEADYALDTQTLDLAISTEAMKVQSLRAQAALAAVPCLEQITAGQWSGELHYHRAPTEAAWNGRLGLTDAAIAIPASIISTFALMYAMGFTLNMLTLLALTLAVGIVIDDAIVVLENIYRHMEEMGLSPFAAAIQGTREIGLAVLATTLSLVTVFLPVAFMGGIVGRSLEVYMTNDQLAGARPEPMSSSRTARKPFSAISRSAAVSRADRRSDFCWLRRVTASDMGPSGSTSGRFG